MRSIQLVSLGVTLCGLVHAAPAFAFDNREIATCVVAELGDGNRNFASETFFVPAKWEEGDTEDAFDMVFGPAFESHVRKSQNIPASTTTVVLGCSHHSISECSDETCWGIRHFRETLDREIPKPSWLTWVPGFDAIAARRAVVVAWEPDAATRDDARRLALEVQDENARPIDDAHPKGFMYCMAVDARPATDGVCAAQPATNTGYLSAIYPGMYADEHDFANHTNVCYLDARCTGHYLLRVVERRRATQLLVMKTQTSHPAPTDSKWAPKVHGVEARAITPTLVLKVEDGPSKEELARQEAERVKAAQQAEADAAKKKAEAEKASAEADARIKANRAKAEKARAKAAADAAKHKACVAGDKSQCTKNDSKGGAVKQ